MLSIVLLGSAFRFQFFFPYFAFNLFFDKRLGREFIIMILDESLMYIYIISLHIMYRPLVARPCISSFFSLQMTGNYGCSQI